MVVMLQVHYTHVRVCVFVKLAKHRFGDGCDFLHLLIVIAILTLFFHKTNYKANIPKRSKLTLFNFLPHGFIFSIR